MQYSYALFTTADPKALSIQEEYEKLFGEMPNLSDLIWLKELSFYGKKIGVTDQYEEAKHIMSVPGHVLYAVLLDSKGGIRYTTEVTEYTLLNSVGSGDTPIGELIITRDSKHVRVA